MKISLKGLNSKFELARERTSKPEDKAIEITYSKEQKEKKGKLNRALEKCGT